MSLDKNQQLFQDKYLTATDNVFEAINTWCSDAKALRSQTGGRISNSEALSSTLSGSLPNNLNKRIPYCRVEQLYIVRYIKEAIFQIDDIDVKRSVLRTLNASLNRKNLVFIYGDCLSEAQRARVRIASKMVWNNLYGTKGR